MIVEIINLISSARLSLTNEKVLQSQIKNLLTSKYSNIESEKRLDQKNVIDFFIDGIGIEVKIKGSKKEIYKQCVRYCAFGEIKRLILVSSVPSGFPTEINGKDIYIIRLSQAWL